jgi:hypothetical protein
MTQPPTITAAYEQLVSFARDNARIAASYYKSLRAEEVELYPSIQFTIAYIHGHMTNWGRESKPTE